MIDGKSTLVIFPGAGSFGSEFKGLLQAFRPYARLLRYAWRDAPDDSGGYADIDQAVQACARQVQKVAATRPILLGHSFGAYMAYAAAAALQPTGLAPRAVILAAARAPHRLDDERQPRTQAEIEAYWRSLEPGLYDRLPDPSWQDVLVETTRRDLAVFEQVQAESFDRLQIDVLTATGSHDPLVNIEQGRSWADWTDGLHEHRSFPGGHSDFLGSKDFVEWVETATQRMKEPHNVSR